MSTTQAIIVAAALALAAGGALAERNNSAGEGGGNGVHGSGAGHTTYSVAPPSGTVYLDRAVTYGNHSSPNLGREAGGYASGGEGTGGNY